MKIHRPTKFQSYCFWVPMPFIAFASLYIFYRERIWSEWQLWVITYPIMYVLAYFSWRGHLEYDYIIRGRFPSLHQTRKRIMLTLLINVVIMTPSILFIFLFFDFFKIGGYQIRSGDFKYGYVLGLSINLVFEALFEADYYLLKYKESAAEKESLEKLQLQYEFDALKQKVNPHFLFNCFNTLSSLISEDRKRAEQFLDEMSKIYRYLLKSNEDGLSTLENEMKFIKSYFQLLQTRHKDAVFLDSVIEPIYNNYLLPSLSLQMLVENAVKHNTLSKSAPLHIKIFTSGGRKLLISNNLQHKTLKVQSNKIGLENIRNKYNLLRVDGFTAGEAGTEFIAELPLIKQNELYETPGTEKY